MPAPKSFSLDTNILVRYIIQDDKLQSTKAASIIENLKPEAPAFISCIVLCEINWVLKTAYKFSKADCAEALNRIMSVAVFDIENLEACLAALQRFRAGQADFSDYLIRQIAKGKGYDTVLTFDKKALKSSGFASP
ncbi:MAG: type II toxin-antitoxin system VapC family toxin [Robiginitomaculum sp.]|nr:type II toxin-antitoxin system VapC family toxin [Robiginitomaculum sp.]